MELPSPGLNVEAAPEMPIEAAVEVASEKPEPVLAEAPSEISTPLTEAQPAEIPAIVEPAVLEEPVANEEPVSESPAPESIEFPPAGVHEVPAPVASGEMDPDAAFAWLESLAAQQGADEATLSTSKEERKIKPPTWVTEASEPSVEVSLTPQPVPELFAIEPEAPVAQEILPEVAFEPPQTPAIPAVELPQSSIEDTQPISVGEWVQEVQQPTAPEPAPEPVLASTSTPVEQEEEPLPAWLQGLDQPPAGTKQLTPPEGMEDLPDWLKGFDTQLEPASVPAPAESASVSSWLNEQDVSPQSDVTPFAPASVEQPLPLEPAYVPSAPIAAASASPEDAGLKGFVPSQNPLIVQAQSHLGSGQVDPALDLYNQVIGQGQDLHAVIQDLTTAAYRYPVDVGLWQTLGDAYKQNDQIQEALDAYTKAEDLLR
jgi:hypothetical protein